MDQAKLISFPCVLPIAKGITVRFLNSDPILHIAFCPIIKQGSYQTHNLGRWGKGAVKKYSFEKMGSTFFCAKYIQKWRRILSSGRTFFVVVGKDGSYEISNVPSGEY